MLHLEKRLRLFPVTSSLLWPCPALSLLSLHHQHGINGTGSQIVPSLDPWLTANMTLNLLPSDMFISLYHASGLAFLASFIERNVAELRLSVPMSPVQASAGLMCFTSHSGSLPSRREGCLPEDERARGAETRYRSRGSPVSRSAPLPAPPATDPATDL